ncbi:hypothetical protein F2Q68_00033330 [Brassica cretica]|uniref:tyrosine--tRNA ligase n=1 Tax=Brassica cretica TaxID=69181 RepID=A0A8S9GFN4_BRACR|nr:hypothetical protein F2Q68_00033330 [Brassica cretica]
MTKAIVPASLLKKGHGNIVNLMAYATGVTPASRSIFPICSRALCGHQAVGLIGDPSGKSLERPELDALTLEKNIAGIKNILVKILGGNARLLCDFLITTMLDFLKNVGRFARVGQMMAKESVKKRLESEQGMSYTEFSYQLLQGYDFVHLLDKEGVNVQIGGSDHSWN